MGRHKAVEIDDTGDPGQQNDQLTRSHSARGPLERVARALSENPYTPPPLLSTKETRRDRNRDLGRYADRGVLHS